MSKAADEVSKTIRDLMNRKRDYVYKRNYHRDEISKLDAEINHLEDQITRISLRLIYLD